jgi:hypothetical protein
MQALDRMGYAALTHATGSYIESVPPTYPNITKHQPIVPCASVNVSLYRSPKWQVSGRLNEDFPHSMHRLIAEFAFGDKPASPKT